MYTLRVASRVGVDNAGGTPEGGYAFLPAEFLWAISSRLWVVPVGERCDGASAA